MHVSNSHDEGINKKLFVHFTTFAVSKKKIYLAIYYIILKGYWMK